MELFSVVIATRDRPELFSQALSSVIAQQGALPQIIVVNDGSDDVYSKAYRDTLEAIGGCVEYYTLPRRPNGHGQSYALNYGVSKADNRYVCFLDDDDIWTDDGYLARISAAIEHRSIAPDLVFSNQVAFCGESRREGRIWLEGLDKALAASGRAPAKDGLFKISVDDLMRFGNFCHLNTTIVGRELYEAISGMDEAIRWECDHDLYLRLIDSAESILFSPSFVARHNIPDPVAASSITTSLTQTQRLLYQLRVFNKASLYAKHPAIRRHGEQYVGYTLKRIAIGLASDGDYQSAAFYARQALGALPSIKWFGYASYLLLRSVGGRRSE